MEKAFSYLRVSGKGQIDGDGFERQRETIQHYAGLNSVTIIHEFTDTITGKTELAHREGLAAVLERVQAEGVRLVIVERADRLARDVVVSELILRKFREHGVRVVSADGGVDLTKGDDTEPTAKLVRHILGAISEFDRCVIVLKLRDARQRIRKTQGRCEGRKPFGTKPGEAAAVERMLDLRRANRGKDRMPFAGIADKLNADGVQTRTGKPWQPATVYKIVRQQAPQLAAAK